MRSRNILPLWLLWLTQGQASVLPQGEQNSLDSLDDSNQEFKRDLETSAFEYLTTYDKEDIIPVTETVKVSTSKAGTTATAQVLPSLSDVEPHTEGFRLALDQVVLIIRINPRVYVNALEHNQVA